MTTYLLTQKGIKSVPMSAVKPEIWAQWWGNSTQTSGDTDILTLYKSIPWLYRGINAVANSVASVPYAIHVRTENGKEVEDTALPFEINLNSLLDKWAGDLQLYGAAYGVKDYNKSGVFKQFRPYQPSSIEPQYSTAEGLIGFIRTLEGNSFTVPMDRMAYAWITNREKETGPGTPAAVAALQAAGVLHSLDSFIDNFIENGAINPTLVSIPGQTTESDKERLKAWYRRALRGLKNAFGIEVISQDHKISTTGYPIKDLLPVEVNNAKREDVATALGVPQTLLFSNAANYATALQDDLHFYEKTVKPLVKLIVSALNRYVFIPAGYYLKAHFERMEIYQRLEVEKAGAVISLYEAGLMEYEESREHMNLPPRPLNAAGEEIHVSPESRTHVLGYHIEQGVVSKNEARAVLGLTPVDDSAGERLRNLASQLSLLQAATAAGIPFEAAAVMIGLDIPKVATPSGTNPPADNTTGKAFLDELKKWERMAGKRWQEGKPQKALDFTSAVIPASLAAAIRGQLGAVQNAAHLSAVFKNAAQFEAYP